MQRRRFAREFKLEAVRMVRERAVAVAQAARARFFTSMIRDMIANG